jgi:hypothetical protein
MSSFQTYAAFEILLRTISHTRHSKLPERKKVLIVHYSISKKYGPCLKYPKYTAFTVLTNVLVHS